MRIALDAMGGDFAPGPIIAGALQAVQSDTELSVVLVWSLVWVTRTWVLCASRRKAVAWTIRSLSR